MLGVNVLSLPMWSSGANELMEVHPYPWAFSLLTMLISLLESFPCLNITRCFRVLAILGMFTPAFK